MSTTTATVDARRIRLKAWIDKHFNGVQANFVAATGINQGELSGLLKSKSFGEKKAAALEVQAGMPPGYLVNPLPGAVPAPSGGASHVRRFDLEILSVAIEKVSVGGYVDADALADEYERLKSLSASDIADRRRNEGDHDGTEQRRDSGAGKHPQRPRRAGKK